MAKPASGKRVCVVGSGYVGLVTGACLARIGHTVCCVDSDAGKVRTLKAGKIPIYEPGLEPLVKEGVKRGRLTFSDSIAAGMRLPGGQAEVVFIAVGTPPRPDGSADLTAVEEAARTVAEHLKTYAVIADKSTVPVETGDWVLKTVSRRLKGGVPFDVASNPEFLREGSAVEDFLKPDRIVVGVSSPRAEAVLRELYAPLAAPVLVTDVKSAELIKHASNSFLAMKISYANALSAVCEKVGADVSLVARGMGLDRRIGSSFLSAGVGYGGFCFPKDLEAFYWICQKKGYDFKLLKDVMEINEEQKGWVLRKVSEELWNLEGKRAAVLGLSFKPNTDDLRFAPALDIIAGLQKAGMEVRAYDPVAMTKAKRLLKGVTLCRDAYACAKGADALILVTEWPEFAKLDLRRIRAGLRVPLLLDGRNLFDPAAARRLGFTYRSVGRP